MMAGDVSPVAMFNSKLVILSQDDEHTIFGRLHYRFFKVDVEQHTMAFSFREPLLPKATGPKLDHLRTAGPCVMGRGNAVSGRGSAKANSANSSQRELTTPLQRTSFQGSVHLQVGSHGLNKVNLFFNFSPKQTRNKPQGSRSRPQNWEVPPSVIWGASFPTDYAHWGDWCREEYSREKVNKFLCTIFQTPCSFVFFGRR